MNELYLTIYLNNKNVRFTVSSCTVKFSTIDFSLLDISSTEFTGNVFAPILNKTLVDNKPTNLTISMLASIEICKEKDLQYLASRLEEEACGVKFTLFNRERLEAE